MVLSFEDVLSFKLGCRIPGPSGFSWIFLILRLAKSRGANRAWHTPLVFPSFEAPGNEQRQQGR